MKTDLAEIRNTLQSLLNDQVPPLKINKASTDNFEVSGNKPTMQGKKKVDGIYFASLIPKPKEIRFYFFPIYTHVAEFHISPELKKLQKGKSCFHIKKLSPEIEDELKQMIDKGIELYKKDDMI